MNDIIQDYTMSDGSANIISSEDIQPNAAYHRLSLIPENELTNIIVDFILF